MQLDAIKAERGEAPDDSALVQSLAQVLADAKAAKEAAFQAQWTLMKTGGCDHALLAS